MDAAELDEILSPEAMTDAGHRREAPVKRTRLGLIVLAAICGGGPSGPHLGVVAAQQDRGRRLFPPEELGVLEGADRDAWQKPDLIMDALRIGDGSVVADVGAGGGWFTVRLARRVGPNGKVYAEDIQPEMLAAIRRRVLREGFSNVLYVHGKTADPGLPADALDAVLIVDAYHEIANPVNLLQHLGAVAQAGGPHRDRRLHARRRRPRPSAQSACRCAEGDRRGVAGRPPAREPRDVPGLSVLADTWTLRVMSRLDGDKQN